MVADNLISCYMLLIFHIRNSEIKLLVRQLNIIIIGSLLLLTCPNGCGHVIRNQENKFWLNFVRVEEVNFSLFSWFNYHHIIINIIKINKKKGVQNKTKKYTKVLTAAFSVERTRNLITKTIWCPLFIFISLVHTVLPAHTQIYWPPFGVNSTVVCSSLIPKMAYRYIIRR